MRTRRGAPRFAWISGTESSDGGGGVVSCWLVAFGQVYCGRNLAQLSAVYK